MKASQYIELANDLEINKAITYLRQKDFNQVSFKNQMKFHVLIDESNNIWKVLSRVMLPLNTLKLSDFCRSLISVSMVFL